MNANQLRDGIKKYWEDNGLNIVVTKKGYDSSDVETTTTADIVKYIFEIKLDRMVATASTSAMIVTGITTNANIAFVRNSVDSAAPMTGKWKIKCVYPDASVAYTNALNLDASAHTIQRHISEQCPKMRNRIVVSMFDSPYTHHNIGK